MKKIENNYHFITENVNELIDLLGKDFPITYKFHSKGRDFYPIEKILDKEFMSDVRDLFIEDCIRTKFTDRVFIVKANKIAYDYYKPYANKCIEIEFYTE